ncbi:GNAT family protein [Mesorhizobium sp.]|uniref:GNAT family N-acetyltransferase n=1 Tax=Mesorhizobium sp. TaxID=1871066 RepID=UPI000FE96855|nr:MAG: N-acetyltransferase [Mesorhizobium sp.]
MHILETSRLILKPPSHSDDLLLHALHNDPFVVNAIGDGVYPTIEQSKAELLQFIKHWQLNRFGLWMVFVKGKGQTREFAGYCGLICRGQYLSEISNNVEIVTCLHLTASGKGIAVEAGRAVVQFAFERLGVKKVTGWVRPENRRSLRKNLKIGFLHAGYRMLLEITPETAVRIDNLLVLDYAEPHVHT